jgi:hypothetical protein
MYLSRRREESGMQMNKTELVDRALGIAIKASVLSEVPVLLLEEERRTDPGMYVENEAEVVPVRERRRIFARVSGWKIEWLT